MASRKRSARRVPKPARMVAVPLRLDRPLLDSMEDLARLAGFPVATVIGVCVALGFLKQHAEAAAGLAAYERLRGPLPLPGKPVRLIRGRRKRRRAAS